MPAGVAELEIGATLGLVIGRTACRVSEADALAHRGWLRDRQRRQRAARRRTTGLRCASRRATRFCPIGPFVRARCDRLARRARHRGRDRRRDRAARQHRRADPLGGATDRRRQRVHDAGARRRALGRRRGRRAASARGPAREHRDRRPGPARQPACRRRSRSHDQPPSSARAGRLRRRHPRRRSSTPDGVQLADGRVLAETQVVWLPPFEVGTILALGLNYADHAKELAGAQGAERRAAGLPQGRERADRPPRVHPPAERREVHALRVRAGGGHRQRPRRT